ncbi:protein kinase domain-containing protein [Natronomonas moolapensis]|nr:protein kinase [Natronomonas moolapensis]
MGVGDDQEGDETIDLSDIFLYSLLGAEAIHVLFLIGSTVLEEGFLSEVLLWGGLLTILLVPVLGYLDLRRLRTAGYWEPHGRGSFWVLGMLFPFVSPSVVIAYVLRRRELVTHDGFWGRWAYVSGTAVAALTLSIVGLLIFGDPSTEGNTIGQNVAVSIFIAFTLLPSLTTYFDLQYLRRAWSHDFSFINWLWVPMMLVWFFQIIFFTAYGYWRRKFLDGKRWIKTTEDTLNKTRSQLEEGVSALESDQYDSALSCFNRAEQSLDNANAIVRRFIDESSDEYPKHAQKVISEISEMQRHIEGNRAHSEAAIALEAGLDALDDNKIESAIDSFETAIDRSETALGTVDEQATTNKIRKTSLRARNELEATLEQYIDERILPLENRIETTYEDGISALKAGNYDEAADCFSEVDDYLSELQSRVKAYGLNRDLPVDSDDVAEKMTTVERQRIVSEELDPLADQIESMYEEGVSALEAGNYEAALDRFEEAKDAIEQFQSVQANHGFDRDPPITSDEVVDQIDTVECEHERAAIESCLSRVGEARSEGKSAMGANEYDRAVTTLEHAREEFKDVSSLIAKSSLNEWDLEERESTLNELYETAVTERETQRYRDSKERGETLLDEAIASAEAGNYATAIKTCNEAHEAFEEAQAVAEELSVVGGDQIEDRLDDISDLLSDYQIRELSERVTDARVSVDEGDREQYLTAANDLDELTAELDGQEIDRERDLAVLREEAELERLKALLLAERERSIEAIEAFRDGDYATARDYFEDIQSVVAGIRADAEEAGVTDYDGVIEQLESTCERNATAARRGALGIDDDPTVTPITVSMGNRNDSSQSPDDSVSVPVATDDPASSIRRSGGASLDDALLDALPVAEVRGHIGSGGNADVYEVRLDSGERAALKVPRWQGTLSATLIDEFENEAETWSKLDEHDGIVSVINWDNEPLPWLLLEYLPASLANRMDSLSVDSGVSVLVDVADALEFAHGRGVVHLDVKPENVLLTDTDTPKVGDWGLSQVVLNHKRTGMGLTPPYSAPEQLSDEYGDIDRRTDIYQLSALAYRVLTGRVPFDADRPIDLQQQILREDPTPPSTINPALDPAIDDVLVRGLAKNPDDRYEAAVLFRNAISSLAR